MAESWTPDDDDTMIEEGYALDRIVFAPDAIHMSSNYHQLFPHTPPLPVMDPIENERLIEAKADFREAELTRRASWKSSKYEWRLRGGKLYGLLESGEKVWKVDAVPETVTEGAWSAEAVGNSAGVRKTPESGSSRQLCSVGQDGRAGLRVGLQHLLAKGSSAASRGRRLLTKNVLALGEKILLSTIPKIEREIWSEVEKRNMRGMRRSSAERGIFFSSELGGLESRETRQRNEQDLSTDAASIIDAYLLPDSNQRLRRMLSPSRVAASGDSSTPSHLTLAPTRKLWRSVEELGEDEDTQLMETPLQKVENEELA